MPPRSSIPALDVLPLRAATVDLQTRQIHRAGGVKELLTTREAAVLAQLADAPDTVVAAEALLLQIWGRGWSGEPAELGVVRNTVFKLRQKVERDAAAPDHVLTVQGEGYRFVPLRVAPAERWAPANALATPPAVLPPPGDAWEQRWDVGRAAEARLAADCLARPRAPLVLVAPWRSGKSWMLRRILHGLDADDAVARLSPRAAPPEALTDLSRFCELLALLIAEATGQPEEVAEQALAGPGPLSWRLKRWMERVALPAAPGRVVLAFDDLDRVASTPVFGDLMALLRSWTEEDRAPWQRLRILCTSATSMTRLTARLSSSPFNLGVTVPLSGLGAQDIWELSTRARIDGAPEHAARLAQAVGGHPYLVRLILRFALERGLEEATSPAGLAEALYPVGREFNQRFDANPELRDSLLAALSSPNEALPDGRIEPLLRLGLLASDRAPYRSGCPALTDLLAQ